jgi:hypothetical protein
MQTTPRPATERIALFASILEDLARVLALPDLTEEERRDYLECVANAEARLDEARAELEAA